MKRSLVLLLMGCLGLILFVGWANSEDEATKLLREAAQLVKSAQEAEKTSYAEAFRLYTEALAKVEKITVAYPSSPLAVKLTQGEAKIGLYTLTELKETIVPQAKMKAEANEKRPVNNHPAAIQVGSLVPVSPLIQKAFRKSSHRHK